ncbi:5'-3' exoribonuclease 1 isoform X2 [Nematostella vectensis]|uniref:5'-3' exoribonuclease 1 isoform X2 n=1 Tax=Nematostella vectensis TaxID=45351 RepID=UPI00207746DE|nr:5'-3' exoribonuclease 1 isoform X2 [Nematostella vectensis]
MGVPKFYRWVSERYPCLSQVVQEHQIPEFDNMYLDMNGIIHPCSHPNDDDPHFRITEEQIFTNIFHYIEVLFQIIKPKKVFFMAVDGVAPRAKMNQQRGRRFRSAKEAEDNIRKALAKGQVLPKEERFDSNCITPGTLFMARLQEQLQYFVNDKISNDPAWQGLRIYLSGQQTPGEGEHKIMEFIRTERTRPDYDANTRHCLYGLDADLMMLGLTSHEPHFSLLREEVRFGKTSKRIEKPEQITFHLLHLSLFREYLDWEFHPLKDSLPFEYDLERIIDDWILMGFLVGNDFIPHLPYMHINHDALPMLYQIYKEIMPSLDGYLHDGGTLCLPRFEKYLKELSKFDREKFNESFVDMKWFEAKVKHKFGEKKGARHSQLNPKVRQGNDSSDNPFSALDSLAVEFEEFKTDDDPEISPELAKLAAKMDDGDGDSEEVDEFEIEFAMHKKSYYSDKFGLEHVDSDVVSKITLEYVRGIQWILHYYFNGVQSWSWYYPFHYAPFLSDIKDFSHYELKFDMSKPFLPFEQLLGVLPAASKQLLPAPFQNLMIMEQSPIIDYYPLNFKTDLNGKQQEWEAVVLIPFIDEKRLLEAMKPLYRQLTKEEKTRNTHGPCHLYTYDKTLADHYPSTLPGVFPDISRCHARCEKFDREQLVSSLENLVKGLLKDVKLEVYFPGFPTLYHIPHTAELKKASVKVFQMHSRSDSMILKLQQSQLEPTIRVAEKYLGETCYVGWPHMVEALVVAVSDNTFRYSRKKGEKDIQQDILSEEDGWEKQVKSFAQSQMERRGIDVGAVEILIDACPVIGRRFLCSAKGQVTLEKEWSPVPKQYAFQTVVKDISVHESVSTDSMRTIDELFPVDCVCFMLAMPHYGASGTVLEVDVKQGRVRVQLRVPEEPNIASIAKQREDLSVGYLPSHVVAQKMGISSSLLGKITAKFFIEQGSREKSKGQGNKKIDIGLNLKLTKQNKELLGYTRRTQNGWMFTQAARNVITQYINKFPKLFDALATLQQSDQVYEADMLDHGIDLSVLTDVQNWLKSLPLQKQTVVTCGSDALDDPVLEAIEEAVKKVKTSLPPKIVKVRVRPYLLFRPSDFLGNTLPDSDTEIQLFDRVVNVKLNSAVPFGLRGTVVGFHIGEDDDELVEVLFDEHFIGAQSIRRTTNGVYLAHPSSLIDLTFGERQEMRKRGETAIPPRPLKQSFATALAGENGRRGAGSNRSPHRGRERQDGSPRPSGHDKHGVGPDSKRDSPAPEGIRIMSKKTQNGRIADRPEKQATEQSASRDSPGRPAQQNNTKRDTPGKEDTRNAKQEVPPRFAKSADNSNEFANMWQELKSKENSPPEKTNVSTNQESACAQPQSVESEHPETPSDAAKESSQALCDLLQIGRKQDSKEAAKPPDSTPGEDAAQKEPAMRAVSLDELFGSQKTGVKAAPKPAPGNESVLPAQALLQWCHSIGLPPPAFYYIQTDKGLSATVELANGFKCQGTPCKDRMEATQSAAAQALSQMRRMMSQFVPHQQLPFPQRAGVFFPPSGQMPFMQIMPHHAFPTYPVHPMARRPQLGHPLHPQHHQFPRMPPLHAPSMRPAGHKVMHADHVTKTPDKDARRTVPSSPATSPFVPLQVTRRNVAPKSAPSPTNTLSETSREAESTPQKTIHEMLQEASARSVQPETQQAKPSASATVSKPVFEIERERQVSSESNRVNSSKDLADKRENVAECKEGLAGNRKDPADNNEGLADKCSKPSTSQNDSEAGSPSQSKPARRQQSAGRSKPLMAPSFFQKKT